MAGEASPPIDLRDRRFLPRAGLPMVLLIAAAACLAQSQGGALCLGVCEDPAGSSARDTLQIASLVLATIGALWLAVATGRPRTVPAVAVLTSVIVAASLADATDASVGALVVLFIGAPFAALNLVDGNKPRAVTAGATVLAMAFVVAGGVFASIALGVIAFFVLFYVAYLAEMFE